jgi:homogentisate 1,2-dioxygenase
VGRVHQPPPVHQTFQGDGFVICSFCPRPYDFGEGAIPAPYNHSNVDSDEVLFYASEEFMSRKGIEFGSVTHHPDGIPHGPHPGRYEASIGQKWTNELAVMLDSFRPLKVARVVAGAEDPEYHRSWIEAQHARAAGASPVPVAEHRPPHAQATIAH